MSQSRIGLAVAVYLLGQTRERLSLRALLYLCGRVDAYHRHCPDVHMDGGSAAPGRCHSSTQLHRCLHAPSPRYALFGQTLLESARMARSAYRHLLVVGRGRIRRPPRIVRLTRAHGSCHGCVRRSLAALTSTFELRNYVLSELAGAAILIGFAQFSIFAARLSKTLPCPCIRSGWVLSLWPCDRVTREPASAVWRQHGADRNRGYIGDVAGSSWIFRRPPRSRAHSIHLRD